MRVSAFFLTVLLLIICSATVQARIIHVPADSATIQAGIDACVDGDTVLVADGTYTGDGNRNIDFTGKAIVVMSENGSDVTTIDIEGVGRGFYFHSGEGSKSVLQGFTIRGGHVGGVEGGGGILCDQASPIIKDNIIMQNQTTSTSGEGGGICINGGSPYIQNNVIRGNIAEYSDGMFIWVGSGGGIYCNNSAATITGNTIENNSSGGFGGGLCIYDSSNETLEISYNKIVGNSAKGMIYWIPIGLGGGIYCMSSSPTITGNTISGNQTWDGGGGICCENSSPIITNSILWDDSPDEIYVYGGILVATHSNIQGGWEGKGNIDEDPLFVLPDKNDHRLLWESPCIDTGHPDSLDDDGTRSDMGAHSFNQDDYLTLYLTPDMTEVAPGGQLGVTYTLINRWGQSEPFWGLTKIILPGGNPFNLIGPDPFTLPANTTIQQHFNHNVPPSAPLGQYEYWTQIGLPPSKLYDEDWFTFSVVE